MTHGARIPKEFMNFSNRKITPVKRCVVCEKAIRNENESGLCSICLGIEMNWNRRTQGLNK